MALGRSFSENKIFGGNIFFSYRHLILFAKSFPVIQSTEQKFTFKFYEYYILFIYRSYIRKKNLSSRFLKKKYLSYLQSHFPDVYNPEYKTYKLTDKLMKALGNHIQFRQPNYKS